SSRATGTATPTLATATSSWSPPRPWACPSATTRRASWWWTSTTTESSTASSRSTTRAGTDVATRPTIVAVDDDPDVLRAVTADLRRRYEGDYRILSAGGGPEALDAVEELKRRGERVALLVVDQRMPELTGTELLA